MCSPMTSQPSEQKVRPTGNKIHFVDVSGMSVPVVR